MSDSNNLPTQLPPMEHSFQIDVEGNFTRRRFQGEFSCKLLNAKQKAKANLKTASLNAGLGSLLDSDVQVLHYMIGWLDQSLTKYPDWWKNTNSGYELYDANVVEEVYNEVTRFESEWKKQVWGDSDEDREEKAS